MRYLHPDVLDNGPALIASSAVSAILVPFFNIGMSRAQAISIAIVNAAISSSDFVFSNEGSGRKLTFGGKVSPSLSSISLSNDLHVVYVDGTRILWAEPVRPALIIGAQNYRLPEQRLISRQPSSQAINPT